MPTPDHIVHAVAMTFGISVENVKNGTRRYSKPRQIAMLLMRCDLEMQFQEIGVVLGCRDHSTIWHGVRVANASIDSDGAFAASVAAIRDMARQIADGKIAVRASADVELDEAFKRMNKRLRRTKRIRPCLTAIPIRHKGAVKRPEQAFSRGWYAENDARYCAVVSIVHPEKILWSITCTTVAAE